MADLKVGFELGRGFSDFASEIRSAKQSAGSLLEDTGRLGDSVSGLANDFKGFGLAAAGALAGIAAISPSLAGPLAQLEIEFFGIADTLGKELKPEFDAFVGVVKGVGDFLRENQWARELTADLLLMGTVVTLSGPLASGLGAITKNFALLSKFALAGIAIAVTYTIVEEGGKALENLSTEVFGPNLSDKQTQQVQSEGLPSSIPLSGGINSISRALSIARLSGENLINETTGGLLDDFQAQNRANPFRLLDPGGAAISSVGKAIFIQIMDSLGATTDSMTLTE